MAEQSRRAVLTQFLPVVDDFERAFAHALSEAEDSSDPDKSSGGWVDGFRLIERKLRAVLEAEGVRPMQTVGETFDPRLHEAVKVEDGAINPNTVVAEYARGYLIGDEVLRPAKVVVGAGREESET